MSRWIGNHFFLFMAKLFFLSFSKPFLRVVFFAPCRKEKWLQEVFISKCHYVKCMLRWSIIGFKWALDFFLALPFWPEYLNFYECHQIQSCTFYILLYVFHTLCHKLCAQDPFGKNYLAYITVSYDYVWDLQCAGLHWFNEFHILCSCCLNKCYIIDALHHVLCSNCQHVKSTEKNYKELLYKGRGVSVCVREREPRIERENDFFLFLQGSPESAPEVQADGSHPTRSKHCDNPQQLLWEKGN